MYSSQMIDDCNSCAIVLSRRRAARAQPQEQTLQEGYQYGDDNDHTIHHIAENINTTEEDNQQLLILQGMVKGHPASILIDSGATGIYLSLQFQRQTKTTTRRTDNKRTVKMANVK